MIISLPKYFLLLVLGLMGWGNRLHAQMPPRDSIYYYSTQRTLPIESLLGEWQSADSLEHRYTFAFDNNLKEYKILGYSFLEISPGNLSPQGYIPNWPPYYCWISPQSPDRLNLYFYTIGSDTTQMRLVRPR